MSDMIATRVAYGKSLVTLGQENEKVVVFDADVAMATMTHYFKSAYPDRFFDMGIAEANMICAATGMADMGYIPFVSAFAVFGIGRAYDQVRNTVAHGKANVELCMTHGGITAGPDGGSHQAVEDLALTRVLPNLTVMCPCDANQTLKALRLAAEFEGPMYLRMSRMPSPVYDESLPFEAGGSHIMRDGKDLAIFTFGYMVSQSLAAAEILKEHGIDAAVIDLYSIKPIDRERVLEYAKRCGKVVTVEEHSSYGGLGDAVSEVLSEKLPVPHKRIGVRDIFGRSSEPAEIVRRYGLDGEGVAKQILEF